MILVNLTNIIAIMSNCDLCFREAKLSFRDGYICHKCSKYFCLNCQEELIVCRDCYKKQYCKDCAKLLPRNIIDHNKKFNKENYCDRCKTFSCCEGKHNLKECVEILRILKEE